MRALLEVKPEYRAVKIIRVDWDRHSGSPITRELNIPRRSTLVMFRDGKEVGRVIARTSPADIEPLFKAAL